MDYHPTHRAGPWHSGRRVAGRLRTITDAVDFAQKSVLDLGCNGGYFSLALADQARQIVAIDGEAELIRLNIAKQADLGIANIEFQHALITPDLSAGMPEFDIVLFLSVFHHMLCASDAHDWNTETERTAAMAVVAALRDKARILVFEMGYPWEGYDWSPKLPPMDDPCDWVEENIFGPGFEVEILPPPAYQGPIGMLREAAAPTARRTSTAARFVRRSMRIDPRDGRHIFVGRRISAA